MTLILWFTRCYLQSDDDKNHHCCSTEKYYADVMHSLQVWRKQKHGQDRSSYQHHLRLFSEEYLSVEENKWVCIIDSVSVRASGDKEVVETGRLKAIVWESTCSIPKAQTLREPLIMNVLLIIFCSAYTHFMRARRFHQITLACIMHETQQKSDD